MATKGAFIGGVHRITVRLDGHWDLIAGAFSSDPERAAQSAAELGIAAQRSYDSFAAMAKAEAARPDGIDAVARAALVVRPGVAMVSFAGGHVTGRAIAKVARLKPMSMDLGGNAPVIVIHDADLARAVPDCGLGAFWAAGQNCIGVQRIFRQDIVFASFKDAFLAQTAMLTVGDPFDPATDMGPMISEAAARRIEARVEDAIAHGAS